MLFLRLLPAILSFLILGAHFSRDNQTALMAMSLLFSFLLLIKKPWIPKLFQIALLLGALEWMRSLYFYIKAYEENGLSWTKLTFIIGAVAVFTALSTLVFKGKAIKKRYN